MRVHFEEFLNVIVPVFIEGIFGGMEGVFIADD